MASYLLQGVTQHSTLLTANLYELMGSNVDEPTERRWGTYDSAEVPNTVGL